MNPSSRSPLGLLAVLFVVLLGPVSVVSQDGPPRDEWQRPADVLEALGARPGAQIADIGAGGGYFTHHLRRAVGPEGRVYAVDILESAVARLRAELDRQDVRNVDVILGEPDDPRLPYASLDGALIVNAYHEMTEYREMLAAIRSALRPGGRLLILDNPPRDPDASREAQIERHELHIDLAERELLEAGFEVVRRDPRFIAETGIRFDPRMWLLLAVRPETDPQPQRLSGAPPGPEGLFACPFRDPPEVLAERLSPPDSVEARLGGARVKICYSRPAVRGRAIMGDLVPFGVPWRLGANEATALRVDRPVSLGDVGLEAGWYSLYAVPDSDAWTLVVNRLADRDGAVIDDWVRSHDVGRITAPVEDLEALVEDLTVRFESEAPGSVGIVIEWERSRVRVPVGYSTPSGQGTPSRPATWVRSSSRIGPLDVDAGRKCGTFIG